MNKGLVTLCTAIFVTLTPQLFSEESATALFSTFTGRVTGSKVRLRAQPSLEGHVLRETKHGEMVGVIGEKDDFYAVQAPHDIKGYVFRTFILDGVVEGENVNVRLHPDVDAPVIGKLRRGEKVECAVSATNGKWLEVTLPAIVPFYIAKEYVEKCGPLEMLSEVQQRRHEATCHVNSAFHFAQAEMQKPFSEIDLDTLLVRFTSLTTKYAEFPEIVQQAKELSSAVQEQFLQKKVAFLESKANGTVVIEIPKVAKTEVSDLAARIVHSTVAASSEKMALWAPVEESIYHLWMVSNGTGSMEQFYKDEEKEAALLTGTIEAYVKPVKNRPGDFILKENHLPIAFLYSTQVDLEKMVGKKVTLRATPRPNNNFAFPAYFVLSVE